MLEPRAAEASADGPLRQPLDAALRDEVLAMEVRLTRIWQALSLLVLGLAWFLGQRSPRLAIVGSLGALASFAWFTIVGVLLARGRGGPALRFATWVVESVLPWVCVALLAVTQGPAYALGSWLPPLLFGGLLFGSTARLRPFPPLVFGLVGGATHLILYFAWLRPLLSPEEAHNALLVPREQLSRAASVVVGGVLAMVVSQMLRRAIGRADHTARERELFGKYRLVRHVASGGMGAVFEAVYCPEGGFERPVAVKRIHAHLALQESFIRLFRNEAELSARLVHPNIVQVLDFGSVDGTYFLAMELVEGLSLRAFMRRAWKARRAVPAHVVAHVGREILAGVAYAHTGARAADGSLLRVVHRDLCPANVLLSKNGEVKIADFGIARALRDAEATHTRTVAGHTGYMAPEQASLLSVDGRADLFAVGVVLWELLCGKPLFQRGGEGPTMLALIAGHVPPPSSIREDADPAWDRVLGAALAREPDGRPASAAAMASALAALETRPNAAEDLRALVAEMLALPEPEAGEELGTGEASSTRTETSTRVAG